MIAKWEVKESAHLEALLAHPDEPVLIGWRNKEDSLVYLFKDGHQTMLPDRHDLRNHSPTGFNWGYNGSGPAQLALAVCCLVLPDKQALAVYQTLKRQCIAKIKTNGWKWTLTGLRETLLAIMRTIKVPPLCDCDGKDYCPVCDGGMGE